MGADHESVVQQPHSNRTESTVGAVAEPAAAGAAVAEPAAVAGGNHL